MDIKYEIEPVFKIEFFKIKCVNFKKKKKAIERDVPEKWLQVARRLQENAARRQREGLDQ